MAPEADFPAGDTFQGPAELRAAYDRATKALKERDTTIHGLEVELKGHRIARAGFPEGSEGHRLLTDFFQGDLSKTEQLVEFAARYGHKPGTVAAPPAPPPAPDSVEGGDQTLGALQAGSTAAVPAGEQERLAAEITKAQAEGRMKDAIVLKNQLYLLAQAGKR